MLGKLGRRLTLINVVVSGTILIAMALIALGFAERTIVTQYEEDLDMYAQSVMHTLASATTETVSLRIQMPERYNVYYDGDNMTTAFYATTHTLEGMEIATLASSVKVQVAASQSGTTNIMPAYPQNMVSFSITESAENGGLKNYTITGRAAETSVAMPAALLSATPVDTVLVQDTEGVPYRVSAAWIATEGAQQDMMMVFQDRTDEIAARNQLRWLFAGFVLAGMILIVLAGIYLSNRSIRPIEESIRQQQAFVAAASHELRTPVTALRANAEVLRDAPLGEYVPYLDSIQSMSERMSRLISDLTDLARADAGEMHVSMVRMDAAEAAQGALQWIQPLADERGIALHASLVPTMMNGDPDRLRQAVLALLDNALRYTQKGGEITVSAGQKDGMVQVSVADNGPGILDEHKPHVFDRFYRVDAARTRESGGSGLGLSIVRQLVLQMGGSITLKDRSGGGTVFLMQFKALA